MELLDLFDQFVLLLVLALQRLLPVLLPHLPVLVVLKPSLVGLLSLSFLLVPIVESRFAILGTTGKMKMFKLGCV